MEVAAALSGRPSSRRPSRHTPHPLGCRISMRKVKGYQRRDVEFFVNSQAVCLSLPMIRSLRCLRNAKGPSRASPARNSRGFEPSFLVVVNVHTPALLSSPPPPPFLPPLPLYSTIATIVALFLFLYPFFPPPLLPHCSRSLLRRPGPGPPSRLSGQVRWKPPRRFNIPARVI